MAEDRAALLGAAIRAACLAKAPRRTIQAVASAVAGVLARPHTASTHVTVPDVQPSRQRTTSARGDGCSPEELLAALREARSAQRRRKKDRRKAAKAARASAKSMATDADGDGAGCEGIRATPTSAVVPEEKDDVSVPFAKRNRYTKDQDVVTSRYDNLVKNDSHVDERSVAALQAANTRSSSDVSDVSVRTSRCSSRTRDERMAARAMKLPAKPAPTVARHRSRSKKKKQSDGGS